jgi:hypothetical protein
MGNVQDTMGNGNLLRNDTEPCSMRNEGVILLGLEPRTHDLKGRCSTD